MNTFCFGLLLTLGGLFCTQSPQKAKKPLVVFVCGDHEYSGEATLPILAAELEKNYGMRTIVLKSSPDHNSEENIPGLEALKDADLAVFYLRWRRLPADQLAHIEAYLKSGKPVMGFRTTTHAFNFPAGHASEKWNAFGEFALNAPPGWGGKAKHTHYGHSSSTDVSVIPAQAENPILTGVAKNWHVRSWLYHVVPDYPVKGSTWLLTGKAVNPERPAVENPVAWTGTNSFGGKVFMTTLGHPEDFRVEAFQRLLINAIHDELGRKVPKKWKGKIDINVPYRVAN
ncbi:ThuA domain-containing protein [Chitinophaga rhizosphaerae]|uniref:ThuA domain-containing protein n=1 Tax=Chitinophaga rhizosphaerae TaxID=1864947 RepID=UPI000F812A7B|nr:ThuA domain-containing protein [Chitinophaga rhizosphaerae]